MDAGPRPVIYGESMAPVSSEANDWRTFVRSRQFLFDVFLALALLTLGFVSTVTIDDVGLDKYERAPDLLNRVFIAAMTLPLIARRIYPVPVMVTVLAVWAIDRAFDYPTTMATASVLLVFHTIGTELNRRRALLIGGSAVVLIVGWTALGALTLESVPAAAVLYQLVVTAAPLWLGMEIHERRRRVVELEARAERAEQAREEQAKRAVAEERARIARELHDVVAHQMTVITLQADGARRVARGGDPRVTDALDTITATGKSALTEMRRMVGLLRSPGAENGHSEEAARLAPMPGLRDLDDLIDRVAAAGMTVDVEVQGNLRPLDDGAELSAYRVVQEALTNAMRHGGPQVRANVTVSYGDDGLALVVDDSGRGLASWTSDIGAAGSSTPFDSSTGDSSASGHGLVGLRERIAVHGGEFDAGPRPGGGFRVRATIPYEPSLQSEL